MTQKKERLLRDLSVDLIADANHSTRRFFRCWLDGSYLGEDHYRRNVAYLKENHEDKRALRRFVIREFVQYMAYNADCSPSYAQEVIVDNFSKDNLAMLNDQLIDDALDLIEDWILETHVSSIKFKPVEGVSI
jgi:hypothetical protein